MQNSNNIKNEKSYFKKILTTASMLALVTGAASSAEAILWYDDGNGDVILPRDSEEPTHAIDGANTTNWSDDDSFYFVSNNVALTFDDAYVATIDLYGTIDSTNDYRISVTDDSKIGSVVNSKSTDLATIQVANTKTLTLYNKAGVNQNDDDVDPGDFSGVSSITLGSAAGGAGTLVIDNTPTSFDVDINTFDGADVGNITVSAETTFDGDLGQETGGGLGKINVSENTTFNGNVNAATLSLDGDKQVTIKSNFDFTAVESVVDHENTLVFSGSTGSANSIGNENEGLLSIQLSNSNLTSNGDVYADTVTIDTSSELVIGADNVTITGATTLDDASLDVDEYTVTHTGNLTINSTGTLKLAASGAVGSATYGNVAIGGDLVKGADGALVLEIDDTGLDRGIHTLPVVTATTAVGNQFAATDITINAINKLLKWTAALNGNDVEIASSNNTEAYLNSILTGESENLRKIKEADGSNAVNTQMSDLLGNLSATGDAKPLEAVKRVIYAVKGAAEAAAGSLAGAQNLNIARIALSPAAQVASNDDKVSGVAAGEWDDYGVWFSPFVGKTYQSKRNNVAGYDSTSYGATLGFDSKINEDLVLGMSLTAAASHTKHKDFKEGDKTKFKSFLVSVYNSYSLDDDWFMFGSASVGQTRVSSKAQRVSSNTAYEVADGKYTVTSFGIKEMFGYNYFVEDMRVAPMVGMKYTRVNDIKYQESGTTFQNLNISTKSLNKLEAIVGASVTSPTYDCSGTLITPEAHGFVNYELLNNGQKSTVTLGAAALESRSTGPRLSYDLGLGVKAEYAGLEYSAGYDLQLADKRSSHQGTLKVRMNF